MAGTPDKSPDSASGSASDELTPPTMKFGSQASSGNNENTIQVTRNPGTVAGPLKTMPTSSTRGGAHSKTVSDATSDNNEALSAGIETQDLLNDPLLLAAPRVDFRGKPAPCLNGIPLLAMIGRGGMGAVYYGVHPRLRSEVAVKVLPFHLAEQDQGMVRRFFREAQIAAQVRSPHLVNVMDVNEEAGLFFLVMEFVPGRTAGQVLKHYMEKGQPVSEKDTLDVIIAATEGLWAAHGANVVHRDIKPENIMVPYVGRGSKEFDLRRAKLMDLGLARNEDSNQSLTGAQAAMGTPGYMAPEQAMDAKTADKRSDVFSMGATIYCMLNGKPPFRGETVMKILMATMHEPHEPIIKLRPDVSPMLNEITERCLGKKQEHRFKDAKELLSALEDCKRLVAGGMSGSMPTPGTFAYRPTNTPPPGSGTNVTQMGLPSNVEGTAAPAKGKKGMLLVGGGVAAALAAGAAIFAFSGPGTPKIDKDRRVLLEKRFEADMAEVNKSLAKKDDEIEGDLSLLRTYLKELNNSDLVNVDPTYKKKVDDLSKQIAAIGARSELNKQLLALTNFLNADRLDDFKKNLPAVEALPLDDYGKKKIEDLRKAFIVKQTALESKTRFAETLGRMRKAIGEKNVESAQAELTAARKLNEKAPELVILDKEIKALESEVAEKNKMAKMRVDLKEKMTAQDWPAASIIAQELQLLDPRDLEIGKIVTDMNAKLGAEEQKKKEVERRERITKIFTEAKEFQKNKELERAEHALEGLEAIDPGNLAGKALLAEVRKQITDRNLALALEQKRRNADEFLGAAKLLIDSNGDMDAAQQKLESARKELPDDVDYLKKIDDSLALVQSRRDEQKRYKEAEGLLEKAAPLQVSTDLDKLKEGQNLVEKAQQLAPKLAKANALYATFEKKIEEQLKFLAQNKEAHDKLLSSGDTKSANLDAKPLQDQLSGLKLALSDYEDAKKMQPTGPAAKKVDAVKARMTEIAARMERQKNIDTLVAGSDSQAAKGNFDGAIAGLAELQKLDPPTYQKKLDEYNGRKAQAEQIITDQRKAIAAKAAAGRISEALADARTLRNSNIARTELGVIVSALDAAQQADQDVRYDVSAMRSRVARKEAALKGLGANEKGNAVALIQTYESVVLSQVNALVQGDFKTADSFTQTLRDARSAPKYNADSAVSKYEAIPEPQQAKPKPPDDFENESGRRPAVAPQPKPEKKPARKGSVGEGNIDD